MIPPCCYLYFHISLTHWTRLVSQYSIVTVGPLQGEAKFAPESSSSSGLVVSAPPPIRVMPSLPRPGPRVVSPEEERFYARPTKIVPSVIKVKPTVKPSVSSQKPILVPRASKPSVQPENVKKPISAFKSVVTPKDSSNSEEAPVYVPR